MVIDFHIKSLFIIFPIWIIVSVSFKFVFSLSIIVAMFCSVMIHNDFSNLVLDIINDNTSCFHEFIVFLLYFPQKFGPAVKLKFF